MKRLIEILFRVKIFTRIDYDQLTKRIVECGKVYRKYSKRNTYHHSLEIVEIPLLELSKICLVENNVWDDIKTKLSNN